jgi:hypothetical protein
MKFAILNMHNYTSARLLVFRVFNRKLKTFLGNNVNENYGVLRRF